MGSVSRSLKLVPDTDVYRKILRRISDRHSIAQKERSNQENKWVKAEESVLAYVPESEVDAKRRNKREQGEPKYTTLILPYTYANLMSAHTYWTSVFFARSPVHQFSGRHGEGEQQTQALEALISYQVDVGSFLGPYYIWLYDAGKYGVGWLGQYWDRTIIEYGQIVEVEGALYQAIEQVEGYVGNRVYNLSPYDAMPDPRVPVNRFQDGEFFFARKRLGWDRILQRERDGYFINVDRLRRHQYTDRGATNGSPQLGRPDFTRAMFGDTRDDEHPAGGVFWEMYCKVIPKEWGIGESEFPQVWCFTVTEDIGLIVGASPLGYVHGQFPFDVLETEVEGYGAYNRGMPEILESLQNTMDWLLNSHFYNVRASVNNQFILDPSKLVAKDAKKSGPGFIWRLRPEAYGTDIRSMFMQVPVQDVTQNNIRDIQVVQAYGERALGINDQIMGALNASGRKTATEVRTTTGFGVNRQKTITEYMSATGFAPHAQKLVQSTQQLYDAQAKLRRVGNFALEAGERFLTVGPQDIVGYYDFINVDGTLPIDRMAQANLWKELMVGLQRMPPQIMMEYDWSRIFAWVANLAGLKNLGQFKIQVLPPGMAPPSNVVPIRGGRPQIASPGMSSSTESGLNAMTGGPGGPSY